jgi:FKBP-type peptidyl-prolyl cis-trans isomerase
MFSTPARSLVYFSYMTFCENHHPRNCQHFRTTNCTSHTSFRLQALITRQISSGPMPYDEDKMPIYALGLNIGMQISQQTDFKSLLEDDELEILMTGFSDIVKGEETVNPMEVLQKYGPAVNALLRERMEGIVERVKKDGKEYIEGFLDCNEEAEKTDSGMVYYCMKEGTGASPVVQDEVEVHYHGTLTDGTVFDSSVDRGATIKFKLGQVIKGWQEG